VAIRRAHEDDSASKSAAIVKVTARDVGAAAKELADSAAAQALKVAAPA